MSDYIVIYWKPLTSNRQVFMKRMVYLSDAIEFADEKKISRHDVLIVKDLNKKSNEESIYKVENYGFYRVYKFFNRSLFFVFIFVLGFCYLYYKYFKH